MKIIIYNIPAMLFACLAAWMSSNSFDGWGWMIFLSAMSLHTVSRKADKE